VTISLSFNDVYNLCKSQKYGYFFSAGCSEYINLLEFHTRGSYNSSCTNFLLLYEPFTGSVTELLYAAGSDPTSRNKNASQEAHFSAAQLSGIYRVVKLHTAADP
jgi:hypothetical protein